MIKKYPFTKQEGLKDCAATCMQMIIKYYKGYISIDDLNEMLETTKDGVSAFNIKKVAQDIGMNAVGIKATLQEFNENLVLPAIAHTTVDKKYNHYVVIYEINFKNKSLIIADPQSKIKRIKFEEFSTIYNNILIVMYPVKTIEKRNYNNQIFIKDLISKNKSTIKMLLTTSFIYMFLSIISSFYMKYTFDKINYNKNVLSIIFIFFILIKIYQIISNTLRNKILIEFNKRIDATLSLDIFDKILSLPYSYYRNRTSGEIITRYTELRKLREAINKVLLSVFLDLPLTIFSFLVLFILNDKLTLIAVIIMLLYSVIVTLYNKILKANIEQMQIKQANMNTCLIESINGIETIKGLGIKNMIKRKYEILYIKYLKQIVKIDEILNTQNALKELISEIGEMTIIFAGVILLKENQITLGTLLSFNAILVFFLSPIKNLLNLDYTIIEAKKIAKKVFEMVLKETDIKELDNKTGDIIVNNLNFSNNNNLILKNLSLTVKQGKKVLITGPSGSGKSTLLKILMKYYKIDRKQISINNFDLVDSKINHIYISQNETLFTDSIYNNIVYGNSKKFKEVVKACYIDEIINGNLGYNTLIEENGFNISGGQKQRIVLARSIIKPFDILLIDEGLNQIDVNLERKILKNIFRMFQDKTIIIVSHRLENMDLYDKMIKIENGKVTESVERNE
ncbi:MAG: peptidase domain-containing ABC transporter [Bacilli bacterium]